MKLSIIIATFNSEKYLELVLNSILSQTYNRNEYEIILVDGGSKDSTFEISKKFNCKWIVNPKTEPVYAKFLGYKSASGKYIMYLDHDEVLESKDSLKNRISMLDNEKDVKAVTISGYKNPTGFPIVNEYMNEFGDPFSFFIYRLSKAEGFYLNTMKKRFKDMREVKYGNAFTFKKNSILPIIELCAAGSIFNAEYLKSKYPDTLNNPLLIPHFFYLIIEDFPNLAISQNDSIYHYSADTLSRFLNKIKWRIKNNIFYSNTLGKAGFKGRDNFQPSLFRLKKYFFIPYVYLLVPCILDSIYLVTTRKNIYYLIHFPLCFYTASLILINYTLKVFGYKPKLRSYDESVVIDSNL